MSNRDPRDDMDLPYDPDTPEGFVEKMQDHFDQWWDSLNPPGSFNGVSLEKETARVAWNASGEQFWHHLEIVYDCMKGSTEVWNQQSLELAGYIITQFSGDSYTYNLNDYMDWQAKHAEHLHREYNNDTVTITIRPNVAPESELE